MHLVRTVNRLSLGGQWCRRGSATSCQRKDPPVTVMTNKFVSSFPGIIEEIPGIRVDNFTDTGPEVRAYFLSHCHTDHTVGLIDNKLLEKLKRDGTYVYMSRDTAKLISVYYRRIKYNRSDNIAKFIKELNLGENIVTLPVIGREPEEILNVNVITADHCIGSVMFLLSTSSKTVLYTGDFRIYCDDADKFQEFIVDGGGPKHIHTMYMDTTFQRYSEFPKMSDSVEEAINKIREWLDIGEDRAVALHMSSKIGHENVFNEIHANLGIKVNVEQGKWEFYSNHPDMAPGVTKNASPIHECQNKSADIDHESCGYGVNNIYKQFLWVRFSARTEWMDYRTGQPVTRLNGNCLDVCYATHCSGKELKNFVDNLSPDRVVGFSDSYKL